MYFGGLGFILLTFPLLLLITWDTKQMALEILSLLRVELIRRKSEAETRDDGADQGTN